MIILHVIGSLSRAGGGPSRSSQGLVAGLRAAGVDAWLMTLSRGEEPWIKGCDQFVNGGAFEDALVRVKPDIVHLHGIWDARLHRCAVVCRRWKIPYVIAPRGMLEPWSLEQKWLKKRVARFLYQDRDLKKAAALHATAESEAEQFRKLGFKNYVIVSPNGVNVPDGNVKKIGQENRSTADGSDKKKIGQENRSTVDGSDKKKIGQESRSRSTEEGVGSDCCACEGTRTTGGGEFGTLGDRALPETDNSTVHLFSPPIFSPQPHRALFVSRMHPKKGVLELVESWARVFRSEKREVSSEKWICELVYTLNGDTEREYEAKVKQRIRELGMTYEEKCLNGRIDECLNGDGESSSYESNSKSGGVHSSTSTTNFNPAHSNIQTFSHSNISFPDFILTGPLDDTAKWQAYARADLFILPTYSENFGIVVAEALWAGVPVITTKGTPWSELVSHRCGWWIDLPDKKVGQESRSTADESNLCADTGLVGRDPRARRAQETQSVHNSSPLTSHPSLVAWPALDTAIREATNGALIERDLSESSNHSSTSTSNFDSLRAMGADGHALVESKYTWPAVVKAMIHGYEQILNPCESAPCDSCRNYGDMCPIK